MAFAAMSTAPSAPPLHLVKPVHRLADLLFTFESRSNLDTSMWWQSAHLRPANRRMLVLIVGTWIRRGDIPQKVK